MKKRLLSLFSGCGGMDIGFEGGFLTPKATINQQIHKDWVKKEGNDQVQLADTIFETVFANDINEYACIAWNQYFSTKRKKELNGTYKVGSIVDYVKKHQSRERIFS